MTDTSTTPPAPTTNPTVGDYVKVSNLATDDLTCMYDSRKWVVPASATAVMPFETACVYFGDPRSAENMASIRDDLGRVSWVPDRASEVRRLRTLYDNQQGDENVIANAPNVKVYDLNDNPITTVLDDPLGNSTTQHIVTINENERLLSMVSAQQRTIDMLVQRLDNLDPNAAKDIPATATHVDEQSGTAYMSTVQVSTDDELEDAVDLTTDGDGTTIPEDNA